MYGCCPGDNHNYSINTNRCTDRQTDIPTDRHIPTDVQTNQQTNGQTYNIRRADRQRYQQTDIMLKDVQTDKDTNRQTLYQHMDRQTKGPTDQQMDRQ